MDPRDYEGREQALIKHYVLQHYLERLAFKVGGFRSGTTLNYIDGFSGPWDAVASDGGDCSPAIAMTNLARARDTLAALPTPKPMRVRCMFVEQDAAAFTRLEKLCASCTSVEVATLPGTFEANVPAAVRFAESGPHPFAFVFIDPKGWTGYPLQAITPLLQVKRVEVLINFMIKDILRFIDHETSVALASFEDLFGQRSEEYRREWASQIGLDREDAIVSAYCARVRERGNFQHCVSTIVLNPLVDRTHYHLVYATHSRVGLVTFREVERAAMIQQKSVRAAAKQTKRTTKTLQREMFAAEEMDSNYLATLSRRYTTLAQAAVRARLAATERDVSYESLIDAALAFPMSSETDLKAWIREWKAAGSVEAVGPRSGDRTPKLNGGHLFRGAR